MNNTYCGQKCCNSAQLENEIIIANDDSEQRIEIADGEYAGKDHNHDDKYASKNHAHNEYANKTQVRIHRWGSDD